MGPRDSHAGKRHNLTPPQGAIVAVLAFAGLVAAFMIILVVPIQARLPDLLKESREDTAWAVTVTLLVGAITTPISGRLGDMYGKRRIVLVLIALMVVGSVTAALSTGLMGLLIGRGLQGAVSGVVPLGIAILRDVLHANRVGPAIAVVSATMGIGGSLGIPISALVIEYTDWHLLFWWAGALGAAAFAAVLWIVPDSLLRTPARFDFVGALSLAAGLSGVLLAVSRGNEWGWLSPFTAAFGLGGIAMLALWGWFELRSEEPLLDLRVAAHRPVLLTNLASLCMAFTLFASNVVFPQLLELPTATGGFGLSLVAASLAVAPAGLVMMLLSPVAGRLSRIIGPRMLLIVGAVALVASYGLVLVARSEVWQILLANILTGVGIGCGFAAMPMLIMRSVPASETGASNGLNALFRTLGGSAAAAIMGAVLAQSSTVVDHVQIPTPADFLLTYLISAGGSLLALVLALLIPRHRSPEQRRASLLE